MFLNHQISYFDQLQGTNLLHYLLTLPQAVVALYFNAKYSDRQYKKWAFSLALFIISIGMAVGIMGAIKGMWLPRI